MQDKITGESLRPVYQWVPFGVDRVLDIGCSWGDDAVALTKKAKEVYGTDINEKFKKAQIKCPEIKFSVCRAEKLLFEDNFFDVVIMSEVLEHVTNEHAALNEIYRTLKPGGMFILTTPHKGLFGFLDPANQKFYLKKISPRLFKLFISHQLIRNPDYNSVLAQGLHRHYSLEDFHRLFNKSDWRGHYKIEKILRHALFFGPLTGNIRAGMKHLLGERMTKTLIKPLNFIASIDNKINFGSASYQIELMIRKD